MVLKYFHYAVLSAHQGGCKTYHEIDANFWWPQMRREIFDYVRNCDFCQRAKLAQNQRVELYSANPASQPMERLFIDFVGPVTRNNGAI